MKVIVCDLLSTGTRWIFLGPSILVDKLYVGEFLKEYPQAKIAV